MSIIRMFGPDGKVIRIPIGAKRQYESLGFLEVLPQQVEVVEVDEEAGEDTTSGGGNVVGAEPDNDDLVVDVEEKPIAQWSKAEIKNYAKLKGISLEGTKNVGEARNRVREYLEANE